VILRKWEGKQDVAMTDAKTPDGGLALVMADYNDLPELERELPCKYNDHVHKMYVGDYISRAVGNRDEQADWFGGLRSKRDGQRLLDDGWTEGSTKGGGLSLDLQGTIAAVETLRKRATWGEEGDELCADRALRGEWDVAFRTPRTIRTSGSRIVTIVGPWGGNSHRSADELFWTGVQMVVVCDLLEQSGYQTELMGMNVARQYGGYSVAMVRGKLPGEPLRVDNLCALFAHAGLFRSFGFEMISLAAVQTSSSLGSAVNSLGQLQTTLRKMKDNGWVDESAVVIGEAYTREMAIQNIQSTLRAVTQEGA
jgi:hypothetical protein